MLALWTALTHPGDRAEHRERARVRFGELRRHAAGGNVRLGGEALLQALLTGQTHLDIDVKAPLDAEQRFGRLMELLDLADAFCRNERLLTLARSEKQVVFESWLFGEFVRQGRGEEPLPWSSGGQPSLSRAQP